MIHFILDLGWKRLYLTQWRGYVFPTACLPIAVATMPLFGILEKAGVDYRAPFFEEPDKKGEVLENDS